MFEAFLNSPLMQQSYFGNTVGAYVFGAVVFLGLLFIFGLIQYLILRHLKRLAEKTKTDIDDTLIQLVASIRPHFYTFLSFYLALNVVEMNPLIRKGLYVLLLVWAIYQIILIVQILIDYIFKRYTASQSEGDADAGRVAYGTLKNVLKVALWVFGLLVLLSNLGFDVTSILAGLGIGGIAVALAAQNILEDLFSSFAIALDKPFVPGDFIVVGEHMGVVEKIGIKSTRIRALQGEEIVISNKQLIASRIQNFKKMSERRIAFKFGVTYETSSNKVESIPAMIKELVGKQEGLRFDRCAFMNFGDSALVFEAVYYVKTGDYAIYAEKHEALLFGIKRAFEAKKIDMAYPTQTIYVKK